MNLDSIFSAIAYKFLVQVDIPGGSHQHELNGVEVLRQFFGSDQDSHGEITWSYHRDGFEVISEIGNYQFYDARAKSASRTGRSEWRMYYSGKFLENASIGDFLILGRTTDNRLYGFVLEKDSNWQRAAKVLFNLHALNDKFQLLLESDLSEDDLNFYRQSLLSELGLEIGYQDDAEVEKLAENIFSLMNKDGGKFPSTISMATYAWNNTEFDVNDSDTTLISWLDYESRLFYGIEKLEVQTHIEKGFENVDEFISYSLSVQNRRKSRMGYSLQHHLSNIFTLRNVKFQTQQYTEDKNQPDFIFPSIKEYKDPQFDDTRLFMLAAKSTCKERWRQILTEARRIRTKHLCTLEKSISIDQLIEMRNQSVILVIPSQFRQIYSDRQQDEILNINGFIQFIEEHQ